MSEESRSKAAPWEPWLGLFVGLGMLLTAGWAIVETYWG